MARGRRTESRKRSVRAHSVFMPESNSSGSSSCPSNNAMLIGYLAFKKCLSNAHPSFLKCIQANVVEVFEVFIVGFVDIFPNCPFNRFAFLFYQM